MVWFCGIPCLPNDFNWFRLAVDSINLIAVLAGLYNFIHFWKDFRRQKRIEKCLEGAKEVLAVVTETEEALTKLRYSYCYTEHFQKSDSMHLHLEVLARVNKLRNLLMLLRDNHELREEERIVLGQWAKKCERVLLSSATPFSQFALDEIVNELEPTLIIPETASFKQLSELKKVIVKIHDVMPLGSK